MFYTSLEEHRARLRYLEHRAEKVRTARELARQEERRGSRKAIWPWKD